MTRIWAVAALAVAACKSGPDTAKAAAELEAIVAESCACLDVACAVGPAGKLAEWTQRNRRELTAAEQAAMKRMAACSNRAVEAAQDAAPPPAPPDAPVASVDAAPAEPARPAGITDAHVAKLDAMVGTLQAMRAEIAATDDCTAAAKVVTRYWKDFVPVKQQLREVNPTDDPAINDWLTEGHFRRAFGAIGSLVNKGIDGCDENDAWNRAVEATDFLGTKGSR